MKSTKVLITGAAGFLGLHLAKLFSKNNFQIYLIDIASYEKKEYPENCHFFNCDVRNVKLINTLFGQIKPDYVIHAAAALPLWASSDIFTTNVEGTKNIVEASIKNKVKRTIFISSTAVYGVPKKHPIYENDPRVGVGSYGQSKIDAENICFQLINKGANITVLRPKTFLGTHRLGVFEILFDWIHDGKKIPVIGTGNNHYQLLDVDDLVYACCLFIKKDNKKYNDVFNIGALEFNTIKGDFEIFFKAIGSTSGIFKTPAFLVKKALWLFEKLKLSPLYKWVYDTADKDSFVSIDKLINTLNWKPKYSNSDALIKAYRWYLKNYKDIKLRGSGVTHTVGWKQGILGLIKKFM